MRSGDCLWRGTTGAVHGQAPNGEVGVEDSRLTKNVEAFKSGYKDEGELFSKPRMYFPNRSVCVDLLTDIRNLMFPGYFDDDSKAGESSDHLIAERLLHIERVLAGQIANALLFDDADLNPCLARVQAADLSAQFMDELPHVHALLLTDIEALFQGDPAAESRVEVLIAYPGFYATFVYRLAHVLYTLKVPMIPRILTEYAHGRTGIDINPGAQIDEYFFIDHGTGIVIGETTIIGKHVKLYQGVTLGALSTRAGRGLIDKKRHPTIEDGVVIYAGASILGGDTVIGKNTVIGGNTFITGPVPADTRVSIKNPEMEYKTKGQETVKEEIPQGDAWFYVI